MYLNSGGFMADELKKQIKGKKDMNQCHSVKDYGNDPYFIKKAQKSQEFLEKNGFPKEIEIRK